MILCNQAALVGRDIKWLFTSVDPEKKGMLSYDEFKMGIRDVMGLWINEEDCDALCKFIDEDGSEVINYKNFSRIPFKEIVSKVNDRRWFVDKCDFLYCILAESEAKK